MKECVRSDKINYRQFNIFQLNIKNLFSFRKKNRKMSNSSSRNSKNRHRRSRSDPTTSVLGGCVPIRCDIDARMTCSQTNKPDPNGFCK